MSRYIEGRKTCYHSDDYLVALIELHWVYKQIPSKPSGLFVMAKKLRIVSYFD